MPGTSGYKRESYTEVLLWLEDTEIEYTPEGKKAGTKSYIRYNKYAAAKTVIEALNLGSLPLDFVNDFERGILKRSGGPVREQPLNLLEITDTKSLTNTDLVLLRFGYQFMKQAACSKAEVMKLKQSYTAAFRKAKLSSKFGVESANIGEGVNWAETPAMVAQRSRANQDAQQILDEGRKITDEDVLRVLRLWALKKNGDRKNVIPKDRTWVHSETVGLLQCSGGRLIATLHTRAYPKVMLLLTQWVRDNPVEGHEDKTFPFSSIIINSGYAAARHRDKLSVGPTMLRALGNFTGGSLRYWANDDKSNALADLRDEDAELIDVHSSTRLLDGNRAHDVMDYEGEERFSLVFFTAAGWARTAPEVRDELALVGINIPTEEELANTRALLPKPLGYGPGLKRTLQRKDIRKMKRGKKGGSLLSRMMMQAEAKQAEALSKDGAKSSADGSAAERVPKAAPLRGLFVKMARQQKERRAAGVAAACAGGSADAGAKKAKRDAPDCGMENTPVKKAAKSAQSPAANSSEKAPSGAAAPGLATSGPAERSRSRRSVSGVGPLPEKQSPDKKGRRSSSAAGAAKKGAAINVSSFAAFSEAVSSLPQEDAAAAQALADRLRLLASSGAGAPVIRGALEALRRCRPVPDSMLAAAISQAFGQPVVTGLSGEGLAAKAMGDRSRSAPADGASLQLSDVVDALFKGDGLQADHSAVAAALAKTQQTGMEVFCLVRALQAKFGPGPEVVNMAVALAMAP